MLVSCCFVVFLLSLPASGTVLYASGVGSDDPFNDCLSPTNPCSLSLAVSASEDGDTIGLFTSEKYDGTNTITIDKELNLVGIADNANQRATFDCGGIGRPFVVTHKANFTGISITQCGAVNGSVYISDTATGQIWFRDCYMHGNTVVINDFHGDELVAPVIFSVNAGIVLVDCVFDSSNIQCNVAVSALYASAVVIFAGRNAITCTPEQTSRIVNTQFLSSSIFGQFENLRGGVVSAWCLESMTNTTCSNTRTINFYNNGGQSVGTCAYLQGAQKQHINNCNFEKNDVEASETYGGAVASSADYLLITQSTFSSNSMEGALGTGGALYFFGLELVIEDSFFDYNELAITSDVFSDIWEGNGGAIAAYYCNVTIRNSSFTSNQLYLPGYGGAIYIDGNFTASVFIFQSHFTGNFVEGQYGYGGAISLSAVQNITIQQSNFMQNKVQYVYGGSYGGAIYLDSCVEHAIENCSFTNNIIYQHDEQGFPWPPPNFYGGAVYFRSGFDAHVIISNCSFVGNAIITTTVPNESYGGALSIQVGLLTLSNNIFLKNYLSCCGSAQQYGGAVFIYLLDNTQVVDCMFTNNYIDSDKACMSSTTPEGPVHAGGALYMASSVITDSKARPIVHNTSFLYNSVKGCDNFPAGNAAYGGAVFLIGTIKYGVVNCVFFYNKVVGGSGQYSDNMILTPYGGDAYGGAIYSENGQTSIVDCMFIENVAIGGTGSSVSAVILTTVEREKGGCGGTAMGGALFLSQGNHTVFYSYFSANGAVAGTGGAFNTSLAKYYEIELTQFIEYTIGNVDLHSNSGQAYGGAIYIEHGLVSDSVLENNCALSFGIDTKSFVGGGAIASILTVKVTNTTFFNNSASSSFNAYGGAAFLSGQSMFIGSSFENNSAILTSDFSQTSFGGAVSAVSTGNSNLQAHIMDCNFVDNAGNNGGAVYLQQLFNFSNCVFENNIANYGGAIFVNNNGSFGTMEFDTNVAFTAGGALYYYNISSGCGDTCHFSGNTAVYGNDKATVANNLILYSTTNFTWPSLHLVFVLAVTDFYGSFVVEADSAAVVDSTSSNFISGVVGNLVLANGTGFYEYDGIVLLPTPGTNHQNLTFSVFVGVFTLTKTVTIYVLPCPPGYFRPDSSFQSCIKCPSLQYNIDSYICSACPLTPYGAEPCISTPNENHFQFTIMTGFVPSPSRTEVTELRACPNSKACLPSQCTIYGDNIQNKWGIDCSQCIRTDSSKETGACYCKAGYLERLCVKCECLSLDHCWYSSGDFTCAKCATRKNSDFIGDTVVFFFLTIFLILFTENVLMFAISSILFLALVTVIHFGTYLIMNYILFFGINVLLLHTKPKNSGMVTIFQYFCQTSYALLVTTHLASSFSSSSSSPSAMNKFTAMLEVLNLSFAGVECLVPYFGTAFTKLVISMMSPIISMIVIIIVRVGNYKLNEHFPGFMIKMNTVNITLVLKKSRAYIYKILKTDKKFQRNWEEKHISLKSQVINAVLVVFSWTYFDLSGTTFKILQVSCNDGYMYLYRWIPCDNNSEYYIFQLIAAVSLVFYVIGIPALFFWCSYKDEYEDAAGFLFRPFKKKHYFLFLFARRVLLSLCLSQLINGTLSMFVTVLSMLLGFVILHFVVLPFKSTKENIIEFLSNLIVLYTYMCFTAIDWNNVNYVVVIIVAVVNISIILPILYFIIYNFFTNNNHREESMSAPLLLSSSFDSYGTSAKSDDIN